LKIQTVKGFLNSENEIIDTSVADHYIKQAAQRLKLSLEHFLIEPKNHLQPPDPDQREIAGGHLGCHGAFGAKAPCD
jgi:hypothetical protein